jgi:hypothetical protein
MLVNVVPFLLVCHLWIHDINDPFTVLLAIARKNKVSEHNKDRTNHPLLASLDLLHVAGCRESKKGESADLVQASRKQKGKEIPGLCS